MREVDIPWLSRRAALGLAAGGISRHEAHRGDRAALEAELARRGVPIGEAVWRAEEDLGGLVGPLVGVGQAGAIDFFASPRGTLLAMGPYLAARSRFHGPGLPSHLVPIGRSVPISNLPRRGPALSKTADREVRSAGIDDYAIDEAGTVFVCGHSTGGAVVPIASSPRALLERLGLLLGLRGGGGPALRIRPRMGEALARRLGAELQDGASDAFQTWWLVEGAVLQDGDAAGIDVDTTWLWAGSVELLAGAIRALSGTGARGALELPEVARAVLPPDEAPPPEPGLLVPPEDPGAAGGGLGVVLWEGARAVLQEEVRAGKVLARDLVREGAAARFDYRSAADSLAGALSPRAIGWLRGRGAVRDPGRAMSPEVLRERLSALGVPLAEPLLRFEETFGGLCIPSAEGEMFWFGIGLELGAGLAPRSDRVAMGAFPLGAYWMDSLGRVIADDGVVEPFLIAEDARRLLERMAIGQEYPAASFDWPGHIALEMTSGVAAELAVAIGAEPIEELSDACQQVYRKDDLALWSPPAFAEASVAPCVAVASKIASVRALLAAAQAKIPDLGVSVRVRLPTHEERSDEAPPEEPVGVRYERWDDPDPAGSIALEGDGAIVQWIDAPDEIVVERISAEGVRRVRYRRDARSWSS
ncbi:MAG TPA: hypothetical protein VLS89_01555 [Candidatus Nanopelagicales bacterium]|nr:hypothetical protein [Candidatus Nanopelagicales bacterium]